MKAKNVFFGLEVDAAVKDALKGVFCTSFPRVKADKMELRFQVWLKSLFFREEKVIVALDGLLFGGAEGEVKARALSLNLAYPEWRCVAVKDPVKEGCWFLKITEREMKKVKKVNGVEVLEVGESFFGSVVGSDFYASLFLVESLKAIETENLSVESTSRMAA